MRRLFPKTEDPDTLRERVLEKYQGKERINWNNGKEVDRYIETAKIKEG